MLLYDYNSPLGRVFLITDSVSIRGLYFEGQEHFFSGLSELNAGTEPLSPVISAIKWLDCYFSGRGPDFLPPLNPLFETPFRRLVWQELMKIPYGSLTTYKQIAAAVAKRQGREQMSAQAIGGAVGHNPISLMIPCHRVVGSDGSLTGYAGGVWRKSALIRLESGILPENI